MRYRYLVPPCICALVLLSLLYTAHAFSILSFNGGAPTSVTITDITVSPSTFAPNLATGTTIGNLSATQSSGTFSGSFSLRSGVGCTSYYNVVLNALQLGTGNLGSASTTNGGLSGGTGTACLTASEAGVPNFNKSITITGISDLSVQWNAEDYDIGGSGVGFLMGPGACTGGSTLYRTDFASRMNATTGDTGTLGGVAFELGCNTDGTWYNRTGTVPSTGNYTLTMSVAQVDTTPGAWTVKIDSTTVGSLTIPTTGSNTAFQEATSGSFNVTAGVPHVLQVLCANPTRSCGDWAYAKLAPPVSPTISDVALSNGLNFTTPFAGTVDTLGATCSPVSCAGATFTLSTASPCVGTNNGNFTISGSNLNTVGTLNAGNYVIGIAVHFAGATNDGACFAKTLVGSNNTSAGIVFNHSADINNFASSPTPATPYTLGTNSAILEASLEFAGCTAPSITYGGVAMVRPTGAITTVAQGANNPEAFFYLFNPPAGTNNFVVTCPGANFLYLMAQDFTDTSGAPTFVGAANTADTVVETTYTSSFNNPAANSFITLAAQNIGGTGSVLGGAGATLRQANKFSSGGLFDSAGPQPTGAYSMTTTVSNNQSGAGPTSKQTHVFIAFNAGGPPTISGIGLASNTFPVPAAVNSTVDTIVSTCCGGNAYSLATSGACTGPDNSLFVNNSGSSSLNVNAINPINTARAYNICVKTDLTGATNTPLFTALTLTGNTVTPTGITFTPSSGSFVDTLSSGTQVGTFQVNMSDGSTNYTGAPSITACIRATGTCPLVIGTKTGTTWPINTSRVLTSADDATTDSITVSAP